MNAPVPMYFTYDAERSVMAPDRPKLADRTFCDGEKYRLGVIEERSASSHNHYFAVLHEAYINLPEKISERFLNEDHFRYDCLIEAGFYDERSMVCGSKAQAQRFAAFLKPINEYARLVVSGCVVIERTAKSQSMSAMGKKDFQASKQAVLEICAVLINTPLEELSANAAKAA